MQSEETHVKILFRYYSNVLEEITVETMWAFVVDALKGLYKLDSIPFYGAPVSSDDIVFAEHDEAEGMLTYRKTVESSGNSTIQIVMMSKTTDIENIRNKFKEL